MNVKEMKLRENIMNGVENKLVKKRKDKYEKRMIIEKIEQRNEKRQNKSEKMRKRMTKKIKRESKKNWRETTEKNEE